MARAGVGRFNCKRRSTCATWPPVEEIITSRPLAAGYVTAGTDLNREAAYMLLSIIGELRIGTSPRPIMAARLIVPRNTLAETGWSGPAAPDVAAS